MAKRKLRSQHLSLSLQPLDSLTSMAAGKLHADDEPSGWSMISIARISLGRANGGRSTFTGSWSWKHGKSNKCSSAAPILAIVDVPENEADICQSLSRSKLVLCTGREAMKRPSLPILPRSAFVAGTLMIVFSGRVFQQQRTQQHHHQQPLAHFLPVLPFPNSFMFLYSVPPTQGSVIGTRFNNNCPN